ncbi:hypothetical protein Mapa_009133 [Marchantia paleacea]|nr:hypothetical protein Mapa_009133 [Marchantia paleacea]
MPPSWQGMVPPGMDDGSEFPAMSAYALPASLVPPVLVPSADPEAVDNMVHEIMELGIVPVNLANDLAQALVFGIQSTLAFGLPPRR